MTSIFTKHPINTSKAIDEFHRKFLAIAKGTKNKDELTSEEQFAICVAHGMELEIKSGSDENHVVWQTRKKCAIIKLDGEWVVVLES